jgi:Tfp pilus assembly protein PilF
VNQERHDARNVGVSWLTRTAIPSVVAVIAFAAFAPAMNNDFVEWDDGPMFLQNLNYRGLGRDNLRWMFTTFHMGHYQPLSWVTLAVDHAIWGMDPRGYHLTNLLLHAATTVFFYFLCRRLLLLAIEDTDKRRRSSGPPPTDKAARAAVYWAAGAAALLFAIHPLRVESVAWTTERRDVLSGLFFVSALIAYLRCVAPGRKEAVRSSWYAVTIALMLLSLMSKAWGMVLPVLMLVLDVYPLRRFTWGRSEHDPRGDLSRTNHLLSQSVPLVLEKIPMVALAGIAATLAYRAQSVQPMGIISLEEHDLLTRIAQAFYGLAFYPLRTLLPRELAPLYETPVQINLFDTAFLIGAGFTIAATVVAILFARRFPAGLAVWVCYTATIAPVLGVAQSGPQFVADRYSYLSCLGFAVLAGGGLLALARSDFFGRRASPAVACAMAAGVLLAFGVMTWRQTLVWRNTETLWAHVAKISMDGWIPNYNYGTHLLQTGRPFEAVSYLQRAANIHPRHSLIWLNLGRALVRTDRLDEARAAFEQARALLLQPGPAHLELGLLDARAGRIDSAMEHYRLASKDSTQFVWAQLNLGILYARLGRYDEAVSAYESALRVQPGFEPALEELRRVKELKK